MGSQMLFLWLLRVFLILIKDVFLETTLKNILENNGEIAISAYDASSLEGYQIQGKAKYVTEGEVVDMFKEQVSAMFKWQLLPRVL